MRKTRAARKANPKHAPITEWQMPPVFQISHIDPLFRHRLRIRFQEALAGYHVDKIAYADALEMMLAIRCNFDGVLYEERGTALLHALEVYGKIAERYEASILVSLDDRALAPESTSLVEFQQGREIRRASFESLLQKLTSEVEFDGYPSLQCRKCGGQADFNSVQIRSADEPTTIFCTCLNPRCKFQWKM